MRPGESDDGEHTVASDEIFRQLSASLGHSFDATGPSASSSSSSSNNNNNSNRGTSSAPKVVDLSIDTERRRPGAAAAGGDDFSRFYKQRQAAQVAALQESQDDGRGQVYSQNPGNSSNNNRHNNGYDNDHQYQQPQQQQQQYAPGSPYEAEQGGQTRASVEEAALAEGRHPHHPDRLRQRDLDEQKARRLNKRKKIPTPEKDRKCPTYWVIFSRMVTCCFPPPLLSIMGKHTAEIQQAWREKVALVTIIATLCFTVGFLTFGLNVVLCGKEPIRIRHGAVDTQSAVLLGRAYLLKDFYHPPVAGLPDTPDNLLAKPYPNAGGRDMSLMFQNVNMNCKGILTGKLHDAAGNVWNYFPCVLTAEDAQKLPMAGIDKIGCHIGPGSVQARTFLKQLRFMGEVYFSWEDLAREDTNLAVYNGNVLDLNRLHWLDQNIIIPSSFAPFMNGTYAGKDISLSMSYTKDKVKISKCLTDIVKVGVIDQMSLGCVVADIVLIVSLIVILSVVLLRFALAVVFGWVLSWRLGSFDEKTFADKVRRQEVIEAWVDDNTSPYVDSPNSDTVRRQQRIRDNMIPANSSSRFNFDRTNTMGTSEVSAATEIPFPLSLPPPTRSWNTMPASPSRSKTSQSLVGSSMPRPGATMPVTSNNGSRLSRSGLAASVAKLKGEAHECPLLHTLLLVTCYSEGADGLRATCDSLANTSYPSTHKLLLIIADGIIRGENEDKTTPEICLDMMTDFIVPREDVEPQSYIAIADGAKRHNMAKIYAGYYKYADDCEMPMEERQKVPMIVIVKCGSPAEKGDKKPGNRGKRDSQIILMSFLQKVMFDDRMTPLEYEFFNAFWNVTKVTPDFYELVLMVDADTKVYPDALTRMVACMAQDPTVMGLCGETKIANKKESWVSMIQVFEYYISHHLAKAFESIFGGVTCLPGCFCMYRIKAPKGPDRHWVPVLANPDIVEHYSENVVDTLHKKNLLLLGEDRYLTTLMLRTFPKRKMMFVPQAVCKTQVPTSFPVLLSQRRRWINSTIHNLMELVLIRDLCGTFCFSMQFVIFMELVGTVVLPAAISFTLYLIVISFIITPVPIIPLLLLAAILGLPAVLILMTSRKIVYVGWMFMYLWSLPVWNFVLPVYAFWHFDDFTWGQTRKVQGEDTAADTHGSKEGEFDSSKIVMKRWCDFEREKRIKLGLGNGVSGWYQPLSSVVQYDMKEKDDYYDGAGVGDGYGQDEKRRDEEGFPQLQAPNQQQQQQQPNSYQLHQQRQQQQQSEFGRGSRASSMNNFNNGHNGHDNNGGAGVGH